MASNQELMSVERMWSLRLPVLAGTLTCFLAFGGLGLWSATVPLAAATTASGTIVVDGSHKVVQSAVEGTICFIGVRDGDFVQAGQVLLELDATPLAIELQTVRRLLVRNAAQAARLSAERAQIAELSFPEEIAGVTVADFQDVLDEQKALLRDRLAALTAQVATVEHEARVASELATGLRQQADIQVARKNLFARELEIADQLARTGDGTKERVRQVTRALLEAEGELAGLATRSREAAGKAIRSELEIVRIRTAFSESAATELQLVGRERLDLIERYRSLSDRLLRHKIVAPDAGVVINLAVHTIGGVVIPGNSVLEIVPTAVPLVVEAQIRPSEIEHVRRGLPVDIRLKGFQAKRLPRLTGTVIDVSADQLVDRTKGSPFFRVTIRGDKNLEEFVGRAVRPGEVVDVMIIAGQRTLWQYLLEPLTSFLSEGLRG